MNKNPTSNLGRYALKEAVPWNKGLKGIMIPWNRGLTKETDSRVKYNTEKSGLSQRGKKYPRKGLAHIGKKQTLESIIRRTQKLKGRKMSEEHKNKIRAAHLGQRMSEEAKIKLSKARMGVTTWNKGKSNVYTAQQIQKIRNTLKLLWQNPAFAKEQVKKQGRKPNNYELYLDALLQLGFPKEWKYVGDGQIWIAGRNPDFFNTNGKKLLIEFDSKYWHKDKRRDLERDTIYEKCGYKVLSLNEDDLQSEEMLNQKIKEFIIHIEVIQGN